MKYQIVLMHGDHRAVYGEGTAETLIQALRDSVVALETAVARLEAGEPAGQVGIRPEVDAPAPLLASASKPKLDAPYVVDKARLGMECGIPIRAQGPEGQWGAYDLAELKAESVLRWLRSRGGHNSWAESAVLTLLRHTQTIPADAMLEDAASNEPGSGSN